MKQVDRVHFKADTREELLPDFDPSFPCITTRYSFSTGDGSPWHWHPTVEFFYIESGELEYFTPSKRLVFSAGCAGMLNSNVLHRTKASAPGIQFLHLFDPMLIAGSSGSCIESRYVAPLLASANAEVLLLPAQPQHAAILREFRESFFLSQDEIGHELRLRSALSNLWLSFFQLAHALPGQSKPDQNSGAQIRQMLLYIHEHCSCKISAADIARSAHISERACYSLFRDQLHISPIKYLQCHRVRTAWQMLMDSQRSITEIAQSCGFATSSHFARAFREEFGCSPSEFRRSAHAAAQRSTI